MYTADDVETDDSKLAEKFVYYITVDRLLSQSSVLNIKSIKGKSGATEITIDLPETV